MRANGRFSIEHRRSEVAERLMGQPVVVAGVIGVIAHGSTIFDCLNLPPNYDVAGVVGGVLERAEFRWVKAEILKR
jgi:hypothetical protein